VGLVREIWLGHRSFWLMVSGVGFQVSGKVDAISYPEH
jgi:hypothetical protein